jgi:preprotein translocase subunit SecY
VKGTVSKQTRNNWLIDAAVFVGALIASITGIYFLFLPSGGYQGGRNPWYGVMILFERQAWDDLHTWFGALMIAAVAVHFTFHWSWVESMTRRMARALNGKGASLNRRGYFNIAVDAAIAVSFLLAGVSGVYFMFVPGGRWAADPGFLFSRSVWDLIHTWSGVTLIVAAVIHFAIHWRWVAKVTSNVFRWPVLRRAGSAQRNVSGPAGV